MSYPVVANENFINGLSFNEIGRLWGHHCQIRPEMGELSCNSQESFYASCVDIPSRFSLL